MRAYLFEDVFLTKKQRTLGPWRIRQFAANAERSLPAGQREGSRIIETSDGKYGLVTGPRSEFGPWRSADWRDVQMKKREKNVGRRMRPFSTPVG